MLGLVTREPNRAATRIRRGRPPGNIWERAPFERSDSDPPVLQVPDPPLIDWDGASPERTEVRWGATTAGLRTLSGMWYRDEEPLFINGDLSATVENVKASLRHEVETADDDYVLHVDEDEYVSYLVETWRVEPLILHNDQRELEDLGDRNVDVRGDPNRLIRDPSRPAWVPGHAMKLRIPFEGERDLLNLRTNVFTNPPVAGVEDYEIVREFKWATDTGVPFDIEGQSDRLAEQLERFFGWSRDQVEKMNQELEPLAREVLRFRKERLRATRSHLESISIPIRQRADAPKTYDAPIVRRRTPPTRPGRPEATKPEPVFPDEVYEHVVTLVRSWGNAIERTPAPYRDADEETLRDALLPMLNSHYGGAATGETFNAGGKVDVLVRAEDKNVFIGECKKWNGESSLVEAFDQIFRYSTWRDTKLALLLFVGRKNISDVVEKTRSWLENNDHFIAWQDIGDTRELRCTMRWPTDEEIVATVHVTFVHLPASG
jgi:hypothetical protein